MCVRRSNFGTAPNETGSSWTRRLDTEDLLRPRVHCLDERLEPRRSAWPEKPSTVSTLSLRLTRSARGPLVSPTVISSVGGESGDEEADGRERAERHVLSGSCPHRSQDITGPPVTIPEVVRIIAGSSSAISCRSRRRRRCDRTVGEERVLVLVEDTVAEVVTEVLRVRVWIAVASQIIPSRYTGIVGISPVRIASSRTSLSSCDRPSGVPA